MKEKKKYTTCALISCNVSYKNQITADILLDILSRKKEPGSWIGHLDVFFNELPAKILLGFIEENKLSYSDIKMTYDCLPKILQGENFPRIHNGQ